MFFSEDELNNVNRILTELNLQNSDEVVLIDARNDNKQSASNVK